MKQLILRKLVFVGINNFQEINLNNHVNIIYGASNTGKSFILESINFMLGGEKIDKIKELKNYDTIFLELELKDYKNITLQRSVKGGDFLVYEEYLENYKNIKKDYEILSSEHDGNKSLSNFILKYLEWDHKKLAKNNNGVTQNLTIRNLIPICFSNEDTIQSKKSPISSSNDFQSTPARSFFRFLLSGKDDSSIIASIDNTTFKVSKESKLSVYQELMNEFEIGKYQLNNQEDLVEKRNKLELSIKKFNSSIQELKQDTNDILQKKKKAIFNLNEDQIKLQEIELQLSRFNTLKEFYLSDLKRLEFIEEASFLTEINKTNICPTCGKEQLNHNECENLYENNIQAVKKEKEKILRSQKQLNSTFNDLDESRKIIENQIYVENDLIGEIDKNLNLLTTKLDDLNYSITELINERDEIIDFLKSIETYNLLKEKFNRVKQEKNASSKNKPDLSLSTEDVKVFCDYVSDVLLQCGFPGNCHVSYNFDNKVNDIIIDGNDRALNGKGIRALTNAIFKIALVIYCRENNLPHPGFIILDTPLLAYRDPNNKNGPLEQDERIIRNTSVKDKFFNYLVAHSHLCQFIILENIDPPTKFYNHEYVNIIEFTGTNDKGRFGLL